MTSRMQNNNNKKKSMFAFVSILRREDLYNFD